MFTESIQKFTPISILDDSFEKSRKLQEPMLSKMWGNIGLIKP